MKKLTRLSVAELKQLVHRPDVVEMHDVTARDPKLLVQLKAHRNTVQVSYFIKSFNKAICYNKASGWKYVVFEMTDSHLFCNQFQNKKISYITGTLPFAEKLKCLTSEEPVRNNLPNHVR